MLEFNVVCWNCVRFVEHIYAASTNSFTDFYGKGLYVADLANQ